MPEVDDENEVEIKDEDIRIDVYRASGAGIERGNAHKSVHALFRL